ncbi:hypothetical protein CGRA01v4_05610 [Colletotrichum graminicola]|nr:hypothetical protein CGRA01v4_05610 [Colletotrichum graminicola]
MAGGNGSLASQMPSILGEWHGSLVYHY